MNRGPTRSPLPANCLRAGLTCVLLPIQLSFKCIYTTIIKAASYQPTGLAILQDLPCCASAQ